jgi:hypothetical protein
MSKKLVTIVLCGILLAAIVCLVVGLVLYFTALNTTLTVGSSDYEKLSSIRNTNLLMGMICVIVGVSCAALPTLALLVILITYAIDAIKRRRN